MHGMRGPRPVTTTEAGQNPAAWGAPDRERRPWLLMVVLSVAQFMVILDATVVNVALPSIARSLSFPAGGLQWVVTAYVLASGGLVLLGGRAADVAGRRRTFLAGLALFTAGSLASGIAPGAGALIAARAGQGVGAALLTPAACPSSRPATRVRSGRPRWASGARSAGPAPPPACWPAGS